MGDEIARGAFGSVVAHVGMRVPRNAHARIARTASTLDLFALTKNRLRHGIGGIELAGARSTDEKIRLPRMARSHRARQKIPRAILHIELGEQAFGIDVLGHPTRPRRVRLQARDAPDHRKGRNRRRAPQ